MIFEAAEIDLSEEEWDPPTEDESCEGMDDEGFVVGRSRSKRKITGMMPVYVDDVDADAVTNVSTIVQSDFDTDKGDVFRSDVVQLNEVGDEVTVNVIIDVEETVVQC